MKLKINIDNSKVTLEGLSWSEVTQLEIGLIHYINEYKTSLRILEDRKADPEIIKDYRKSLVQAEKLLNSMYPQS